MVFIYIIDICRQIETKIKKMTNVSILSHFEKMK